MFQPMFQPKTKIFAASILGVLILLAGSLVSFTIYLVAKSNAAYDGSSIGYIHVGSHDESYRMSQLLLNNKLVQHALVVPTSLNSEKLVVNRVVPVSTPSHLLLVKTSPELVSAVKAAVKKSYRGSAAPKVVFIPVAKGTAFLTFTPPKRQRHGATDHSSATHRQGSNFFNFGGGSSRGGTTSAPQSHYTTPTPSATGTNSGSLARANGGSSAGGPVADDEDPTAEPTEEDAANSSLVTGVMQLEENAALHMDAVVGTPFVVKVVGRRPEHIWTRGARTSASLRFGWDGSEVDSSSTDGQDSSTAPFYLEITPTEAGAQIVELNYSAPESTTPSKVKIVNVDVAEEE